MKSKIITGTLIKDYHEETPLGTVRLIENGEHYFEIPREDLRAWALARIRITVSETGS